jgi:hypothetical protein
MYQIAHCHWKLLECREGKCGNRRQMLMQVLWFVTPFGLVGRYQRSGVIAGADCMMGCMAT